MLTGRPHHTAVKVRVNDNELFSGRRRGHLCHCSNCRKVAGGICKPMVPHNNFKFEVHTDRHLCCDAVGANLLIEEDKIEYPNGKHGIQVYVV